MFKVHLAEGYPLLSKTLKSVIGTKSNILVSGQPNSPAQCKKQVNRKPKDYAQQLRLYENLLHEVIKSEVHCMLTDTKDLLIRERLLGLLQTCELGQTFINEHSNNLFILLQETGFQFSKHLHSELEERYFHCDVPTNLNDIILSYEQKYELIFFLRECLTNIRKHSGYSHATLQAKLIEPAEHFVLCISDNGVGIPQSLGLKSNTLHLQNDTFSALEQQLARGRKSGMIELYRKASLLKGNLSISSCSKTGTKITLSFPLDL